jgi:chaperone required for assembly of F1-ATPase
MTKDHYFGVTLDGQLQKTLLKDDLLIPTKALAQAIANEWDM